MTERYAPSTAYAGGGVGSTGGSPSFVANSNVAQLYSIRFLLNPYVKSNGVWHDPSQVTAWGDGPSFGSGLIGNGVNTYGTATAWYQTDYGFNFDEGIWDGAENGSSIAYGGTPPDPSSACSARRGFRLEPAALMVQFRRLRI